MLSLRASLLRRLAFVLVMLGLLFGSLLNSHVATAQSIPGVEATYYGYFSDDGETGLMVIHIEPDDPRLAAEFVSPVYAEDFLQDIAILDQYWWAEDLETGYRNQVAGADEYMVFEGELDFYDGWDPGYVMLLSVDQEIFLLAGYRVDSDDLFDLAELVIEEGAAPVEYANLTRMDLSDVEDSGSGDSSSQDETGREVCDSIPELEQYDENGDGVVTIPELRPWVVLHPETDDIIELMESEGYDSIRYTGCGSPT